MQLTRLHRWFDQATAALRGAVALSLCASRAGGLRVAGVSGHAKALLLACGLGAASALAATPPNTAIVNAATASFTTFGVSISTTGTATVVTSAGTPAAVQFFSYAGGTPGLPTPPAGVVSTQNLAATQCSRNGAFTPLAAPQIPGGGTLAVPGPVPLAATSMYAAGDVVFIQVTDLDQNISASVADSVTVTVSMASGDSEVLRLTETGPSTGVFLGYLPTSRAPVQAGNCVLNVAANQRITASYIDDSEQHVAVTAGALIDPVGIVFDSSTGQPVNGAKVTLINTATNLPATVLGNDGVSSYPAVVDSGGTATDAGGASYTFAAGGYQFPRVAPGTYRIQIDPPPGYRFPSTKSTAALMALPGGPFAISAASLGAAFTLVPGPALELDVPLDPGPVGQLDIAKSAGKSVAAAGDFVPYSLTLSNRGAAALGPVTVSDRLPPGFRYQKGSARLNDAATTEPQISPDGRGLQFAVGTLAGNAVATIKYVVQVSAGARPGSAENVAQAVGPVTSNVARAAVMVREDLNGSRAILAGRVMLTASCERPATDSAATRALGNVRVLLEDGTFILTDKDGNWHADNIRPGTHVVQLDTTTLPQGMELRNCDPTSRTAGRDFSQFVNVRGGTLWRADFRLVRTQSCLRQELQRRAQRVELHIGAPVAADAVTATVLLPAGAKVDPARIELDGKPFAGGDLDAGFVTLRLPAQRRNWEHVLSLEVDGVQAGELKAMVRLQAAGQLTVNLKPLALAAGVAQASECASIPEGTRPAAAGAQQQPAADAGKTPEETSLVEKLPYDDKWLAAAPAGNEWMHPQAGFVPALPVVKVAIKHARGTDVELRVNGAPVNPLRFEGTVLSPSGEWMLSNWRSVELRDGANELEAIIRDAGRQVVFQEKRTLHYSVAPARALFDLARSTLVADGRAAPVVAVRMLDRTGKPVRRGLIGEFTIDAPYLSQQQAEAIKRDPLGAGLGGKPKFTIGEDGIALIPLQPTTQSGEAVLRFDFGTGPQEVRAWLNADLREWVLVGFAEGTLGHKKLAGNMEALRDAGVADRLFDQDRLAFYAKGQIKGEYLLTAAYDSAKPRGTNGTALRQIIDPNQFYTLYADNTQPMADAASTGKLYLKIEKTQFYALFGDFDTGLTVTELGRYSRTLTGVKSEYKGERYSYNAFAARTSHSFMKDELQGDGTSGLYRLRARNILLNSDKVRIEVRDRFQPDRVVSVRNLTPFLDYTMDFAQGTLFFREPIASRDVTLNPVFIVAEYEADDQANASLTYGGRAAAKLAPGTEVGLTHIHEGTVGREGRLTAADTTVRLGENTRLKAEVATSDAQTNTGPRSGTAMKAEVVHQDANSTLRAYASNLQPGFGLGQQAAAAQGQRKVGAEGRVKLSDALQVQGAAYMQEDLGTGGQREVLEGQAQWTDKKGLTLTGGGRVASEKDSVGNTSEARQVTGSAAYEMLDRRLVLRAATDLDVGSRGTVNFPNRLALGADYRITQDTTVLATEEFTEGDQLRARTTRLGLRSRLWTGAEAQFGVGQQQSLDAGRLFASMGLVQKIKLDEHWMADFGIDRSQTLASTVNPVGANQPLASGTPPAAGAGILTSDYTAVSAGIAYRDKLWSANARAEVRVGATDHKTNVLLGAQRNLGQGEIVAAGLAILKSESIDSETRNTTARLSYASRPDDSPWMTLEKLEYVEDRQQSLASRLFARKLVSNFNANWKGRDTQVAMQYSAKYVREMLGDTSYSGYTDLMGVEVRHDLTPSWDVGMHGALLHSWSGGSYAYQLGLSLGYRVATNTWVNVGYNLLGFKDPDFTGAEYRGKGVYVNVRMKFDQDTFDLNDRSKGQLPLKP